MSSGTARAGRCPRPDTGDTGSVTAELAIGLVGLTMVLAGVLSVVQVGLVKLATQDAATAAVRALARGETTHAAQFAATRVGGPGTVQISPGAEITTVTFTRPVTILLPGAGQVVVSSTAHALTEEEPG